MKILRIALQILLPLAVLMGALVLAKWIAGKRPEPVVTSSTFVAPEVQVHRVSIGDVRLDIEAQGTVEPFREIDLSAQVGGRATWVSPALRAGGFFAADEVLVRIEKVDYELAVVQQEAAVARARLHLLQERAEAEAALRAWRELEGEAPPDPLVRREPQITDAEQALAAAEAALEKSRLDLGRTEVRAPFAGRVRSANLDIGQLVQPGVPLARIYGTDFVEVRLPLPPRDTAFVDLPLGWRDGDESLLPTPEVELSAEFGGRLCHWEGKIVRTEGELDRKTRQLTAIARVEDPYGQGSTPGRPPLAVGTFVKATIRGRTIPHVALLPRTALDGENRVWIVDAEHHLELRTIEVLRTTPEQIYVSGGLEDGDIVCTTRLQAPVEGMPVRIYEENAR